jgi:hypothetical protein
LLCPLRLLPEIAQRRPAGGQDGKRHR